MKPNFDTHAAFVSLVNSGLSEKQAQQIVETIKDSQGDLVTKTDIKEAILPVIWQIKGLYAMNAAIIAGIVWVANLVIKN